MYFIQNEVVIVAADGLRRAIGAGELHSWNDGIRLGQEAFLHFARHLDLAVDAFPLTGLDNQQVDQFAVSIDMPVCKATDCSSPRSLRE